MRFRHDPGQSIRRFLPVVRFLTLAAALVVPAAIAIPVATGIAAPAAGDLATVQQYLGSVDTMTAQFTQTERAGKELTGPLSLTKPGKIRFQYEKDVPIILVGDGTALFLIAYAVNNVPHCLIGVAQLAVLTHT